jgi:Protein of unknown function (DUF1329)
MGWEVSKEREQKLIKFILKHKFYALLLVLLVAMPSARAAEPEDTEPGLMSQWLAMTANQHEGITSGTTITQRNWRRFQAYMPLGMIELFKGGHFWKMPPDVQIVVGPERSYPLPKSYIEASRKYDGQVSVVHLPDGNNDIAGYAGGEPFLEPQEPDKGYKLLADLWYSYAPYLAVGGHDNPLHTCVQDRFGSINCLIVQYAYRQLAYNTDPRVPANDSRLKDLWFTEWIMVDQPEQSKYTAQLTLFYKDNQRNQELYVFLPSLRRSVRLSLTARCAPVLGTDYIQDDYKGIGFNGGIAMFDAKFLGRRKIISLFGDYRRLAGDFPNHYYMPLGWPKPSWGPWQLRDVDVIDVRRVPARRAGYCQGSRIIYEDARTHYALWEDGYDAGLKLWKTALVAQHQVPDPLLGKVFGSVTSSVWDLQNNHMTNASTQDKDGRDLLANSTAPAEYQDLSRYATPGGLAQIMK